MPKASYEVAVQVNAPVETVYNYVADFPRHVEWNETPVKMKPLQDGPVEVGNKYLTDEANPSNLSFGQKVMFAVAEPVMKLLYGAQDHTEAEITALEPNQRIAWKARLPSTKKGDLMRMSWEIRLQGQDDSTEVTQSCEVDPPDSSPLKGMVNDDMVKTAKAGTSDNLQRLKSILEGQRAS